LKVEANGRRLALREDEAALRQEAMLDGCYVIKSDLPKPIFTKIPIKRAETNGCQLWEWSILNGD
jgi:hypothetical protein